MWLTASAFRSPVSEVNSPSPHKRPRQDFATPSTGIEIKIAAKSDSSTNPQANLAPDAQAKTASSHSMPPFPPQLKAEQTARVSEPVPMTHPLPPHPHPNSILPPTPKTAEKRLPFRDTLISPARSASIEPPIQSSVPTSKRPLTNSAAEPQEYPIKIGAKALRALTSLVQSSFGKVDVNNWIAHACFIASDLDQARRALKDDLYATDQAFLTGRDLEQTLSARGYTPQRVDAFITKVLKVLDGIALAEQEEAEDSQDAQQTIDDLDNSLHEALAKYPNETKEAVESAAKLMEYLVRGKEAQEKKRLEVERRVKVLEGMVKIGEVVGGVVRFLLSESS